jgi:hypothetical protein
MTQPQGGGQVSARNIVKLSVALALVLAEPAFAADVKVTEAPKISGTAKVGSTLKAQGGKWTGPWGTVAGYAWLRCNDSWSTWSCSLIDKATTTSYTVASADQKRYLRVALYAYKGWDWSWAYSSATAAVPVATAPTPTPTPSPAATPATPSPAAAPGIASGGAAEALPSPTPAPVLTADTDGAKTAASKPAKPRMIRPFPIVRISGRVTPAGARVSLLTVRAPKGARITVACAGKACPSRKVARATAIHHIRQFERELRAGTRLTITISKPGHITKVTTITIRRGKVPSRTDRCRLPGKRALVRCPSK